MTTVLDINGNGKGPALSETDSTLLKQFDAMVTGGAPTDSLTEGDSPEELEAAPEEEDNDDIPDVQASRTKPTAAQNPLAKLALVGVASGVVFLIAGFALVTLTSGGSNVTAKNTAPASPSPTATSNGKVFNNANDQMVPGDYKTAAALAQQDKDLAALNETLKNQSGTPSTAPTDSKDKAAAPKPKEIPAVPVPATRSTVVPAPTFAPPAQSVPILSSTSTAALPEPVDPNEEWKRLSQAGSYGAVPPMPPAPVVAAVPVAPTPTTSRPTAPTVPSNSLMSYMGGLPMQVDQAYSQVGMTASGNKAARSLLIGTQAKATLMTDVVWAGEGEAPSFGGTEASPKFIVQLNEPLKFTNGGIAVPQGALLVTVVRPLDKKTGLSDMAVVSVTIGDQEFTPPAGAITIRGEQGGAIVADRFDKGGQIAGLDATLIFTSALQGIGSVMNQATSSSSVSTNGTTTVISTTPPPNYLGAAMDKGFGAFASTLQKRNEAAVQRVIAQPDVFFIPKGRSLQVFVNQSINL